MAYLSTYRTTEVPPRGLRYQVFWVTFQWQDSRCECDGMPLLLQPNRSKYCNQRLIGGRTVCKPIPKRGIDVKETCTRTRRQIWNSLGSRLDSRIRKHWNVPNQLSFFYFMQFYLPMHPSTKLDLRRSGSHTHTDQWREQNLAHSKAFEFIDRKELDCGKDNVR